MRKVILENRAWKGTRLETLQGFKDRQREISFSINYHIPFQKYFVEVYYTFYKRYFKDCYGKAEFFGRTIQDCINWIEKHWNCEVNCINDVIANPD